eukprot:CAMPEP_0197686478 /NCGR_PEP_ID=MMETSP1338-20131121/102553_1 /TAXON_ID=43686 ORGANISM="Pelagodinium beii, Strain RCC1491" /NCGR_SAMPLE_ID=MMETSP1338 /ASSEMBLY_ACC=CAM_ASM_000754 /LENGTH=84 /DNA_ID=CAMNT_0043268427 /DNA_START=415 /DNA_END=669 /DNA_ORIENTATION=-
MMLHTSADAGCIFIQHRDIMLQQQEQMPMPKDLKTTPRCSCMPSTALTIDPSGPRKASPVAITVMLAVKARQRRLKVSVTQEKK